MIILDSEELQQAAVNIIRSANTEPIQHFQAAANFLLSTGSDNPTFAQAVENCKKLEQTYNTLVEGKQALVKQIGGYVDLAEAHARASIGETQVQDASYEARRPEVTF